MVDEQSGVKELRIEYFIVSVFMLIRHLRKFYALQPDRFPVIREFIYRFHTRWREHREDDRDILAFSDSRQQSKNDLEIRDRIMRQLFFEYLAEKDALLLTLDLKRLFSEAERIKIYRRDEGSCQQCLKEGRPREEAVVSWAEYEADHIISWIKGGRTAVENAQVLCGYHNAAKGGS